MPLEQGLLARTFGGIGYIPKRRPQPPNAAPPYSVLQLAHECYQSDGTFPYLGVLIALNRYRTPDNNQRPLLLLAFKAAAAETRPRYQNSAVAVLRRAHMFYPDLDPQIESSATAMLANLQAALTTYDGKQWASELNADGNDLLALLTHIDESQGEELKAQYSLFSTPAKRGGRAARTVGDIGAENRGAERGDPPPANEAARTRPGWGSRGPQPGRASSGWRGAATPGPAPVNCLDAAEKIAVAKEKAFDAAAPSDQFNLGQDFYGDGAPEVDMWAYASQVDVNLAIARAAQISASYFEPLFLERIAVGQEMLHPWWN